MVTTMKKIILIVGLCFFFTLSDNLISQIDTLTIFHLNDTHSCLAPLGPRNEDLQGTQGGIARAATVIGTGKAMGSNVLALHAGDLSIGDIIYNKYLVIPELQILQSIGVDAITIGNHEFDLQPSTLLYELSDIPSTTNISFLSCNLTIDDPELQGLRQIIKGCTIKELPNFKVGIFGLTSPETNYFSLPAPIVVESDCVERAAEIVDSLKSKGCNFIICLSHLGFLFDQQVASNVAGIDLIVGGHDHYTFEKPIEIANPLGVTTYIVQAGAFYKNVGKISFTKENNQLELLEAEIIPLDSSVEENPLIKMTVDDLITDVEQDFPGMFSSKVTTASDLFTEESETSSISGFKDTPVGALITDSYRIFTGTCVGLTVGGATAQPLYEGPIVPADIYRMISYGFCETDNLDYRIVKFNITGVEMKKALDSALSKIDFSDEFLPQVSGMKYEYEFDRPSNQRLTKVYVNQLELSDSQIISVTTNQMVFMALTEVFNIQVSDVFMYENDCEFSVVMDYVKDEEMIVPLTYNNVVDVKTFDNNENMNTALAFSLDQNYPNPFNPTTTIEYKIYKPSQVVLKIYDFLGSETAVLVNEFKYEGDYKVIFDSRKYNLVSGVYFCRLITNSKNEIRKMILLK